jgi:hypothetical protein
MKTRTSFTFAADKLPINELLAKAGLGDTRAQVSLAVRHRDGDGVGRDYAEAMFHWPMHGFYLSESADSWRELHSSTLEGPKWLRK